MNVVSRDVPNEAAESEAERLLGAVPYGSLGLAAGDDGFPIVVPISFAYLEGKVYFHGSAEGEKMRAIRRDARVILSAVESYSLIPSYFSDPSDACPISQFFKSASLRGRATLVEDPGEKAVALEALMRKLQPEGGYRPISAEDHRYRQAIESTTVVRIDVERVTLRLKLGQTLSESRWHEIAERLIERGSSLDALTVAEMRRLSPWNRMPG